MDPIDKLVAFVLDKNVLAATMPIKTLGF